MGMVGSSSGASRGQRLPAGPQQREATPEEPRPFSPATHFSVSARSAYGYRLQAIEAVIVIGANGQILTVEAPAYASLGMRRRRAMPVPVATLFNGGAPLRFLWGPVRSVLEVGAIRSRAGARGSAAEERRKCLALHRLVLEGVGDIALQAFLRFLERQTPPPIADFPTIIGRPRCKLAFRFQYDEHYLHERHAAQLAWKRFLTET